MLVAFGPRVARTEVAYPTRVLIVNTVFCILRGNAAWVHTRRQ